MLETIKISLRISNDAYDEEINDLIDACKVDLKISGIASTLINESDPLIRQAIKTYCKAHFGYDNADSDKLKESYSLLKQHLAISYSEDNESLRQLISLEQSKESEEIDNEV